MSVETENVEAPNWLKELEEKRERRLKARLGHEAGAGAPCIICKDNCPGLDLHFWRKICKVCKCAKEDHDVPDDDIYGWAQFQLLGSKPNKSRKIKLPGKKDEVELEWTPKGLNETVDKYLRTLPPELLPVKGSPAAQERKQLLQKQIPIHDIDPTLCHDLTIAELKQMNEYIAHVKQNSVGVGKVIQLGLNKANLHTISAADAHVLANRLSAQIPNLQVVQLQGANSAKNLPKQMQQNLSLNPQNKNVRNLPNYKPNNVEHHIEEGQTPLKEQLVNVYGDQNINYGNMGQMENLTNKSTLPSYAQSQNNSAKNLPKQIQNLSLSPKNTNARNLPNYTPNNVEHHIEEDQNPLKEQLVNVYGDQNINYGKMGEIENLTNKGALPNYAKSKYKTFTNTQKPQKINSIRDLAYSTYGNEEDHIKPDLNSNRLPPLPPQYKPNELKPSESVQNPSFINVGPINDLTYPVSEIKQAEQKTNDMFYTAPSVPAKQHLNPPITARCHRCKKNFEEDAIVIGIDHSEALFHSSCFKCKGCNQNLADLLYFYDKESDDIYCGRDYAKIRGIPRCKACDELIFVKEYCLAENTTFHVKHFCCFECDMPLAGQNYLMEDYQPWCLSCYNKNKAQTCTACRNVIKPDETGVVIKDLHFHASDECFSCKHCRISLLQSKLLLRNEKLFCSAVCYNAEQTV